MEYKKSTNLKLVLVALFAIMVTGIANAATFTAIASGNWSSSATWSGGVAPGTNITLDDIVIPTGITVTMDQDVEFNGLLSTMEVMGTLNSTTNKKLTMTRGAITGSGTIDIDAIVIGTFGGSTFTGSFTAKSYINAGASLVFTTLIEVTDELFMEAGSITLNAGGNLKLSQNATVTIDDGSLIGNGGLFSTGNDYSIVYKGSSKSTGMELEGSGKKSIEISLDDNIQDLTLSSNVVVAGTINHKMGNLNLNGNDIVFGGDYMSVTGVMIISNNPDASIALRTSNSINGILWFDNNNNQIGSFEVDIDNGGKVIIGSDLEVTNELIIKNGNFQVENAAEFSLGVDANIMIDNGTMIIPNSSFAGSIDYDVMYTGASKNSGVELTGSGLDDVSIDMNDNSATLTLMGDAKVNGKVDLKKGTLVLNDNSLEIAGDYDGDVSTEIKGSAGSELMISTVTKPTKGLSFTADGQMLNRLTVNVTDGSDVELMSDLTVTTVTFTNGSLMIKDNTITVDNGGSISGSNTSRYVKIDGKGMLKMMVGTAGFTSFPVGTPTSYSPANLKANSGATSAYTVNVANGVWSMGTTGTNLAASKSVVNRTWNVKSDAGSNVDLEMKLEWTTSSEVNGFDRSKAYISHYTNGEWDFTATANATTTANGTYEISRNNIKSLSPFAVSDETGLTTGIEPTLISINKMYPNPVTNELICEIDINGTTQIEVMDLRGRVLYNNTITAASASNVAHSIDFSNIPSGVYFVKVFANDTQVMQKIVK